MVMKSSAVANAVPTDRAIALSATDACGSASAGDGSIIARLRDCRPCVDMRRRHGTGGTVGS
jgi:hypothetical protein